MEKGPLKSAEVWLFDFGLRAATENASESVGLCKTSN